MTSIIQNAQPLAEIKKIKTFDLTTSCETSEPHSFNKSSDEVYDTANLTENVDLIAVASNTENLLILNLKNGEKKLVKGHSQSILCVDSPIWSNSLLASGSKDNSIIFWKIEEDLKNNLMEVDNEESEGKGDENKEEEEENVRVKQIAIASGHTHSVSSIAFSHSNKLPFIVSVSHDTTLKLWPLIDLMVKQEENGENKLLKLSSSSTIVAHSKDINSVDISQNDKLCVTASMDKTAKLWNLNTKSMEFVNVGVLSGHKRGVWCARFSENLQLVATCSGDCTIKIFSLLDKTCVKTLEGHQFAILSLLFIEKSLKIISVDGGGILRLWNIKKGICECVEEGHNEKIWSLRRVANNDFNGENENDDDEEIDLKTSYWITGSADGFITIWRDNTKIKKNLTIKAATKRITDQQTLENLLQQNSLFEALLYTLDLDLPFQCLKILRKLSSNLNRKEELEQQKLINLIKKMSKIQLSTLLQYSTQWNTNSKTYFIAQLILNCVLKSFPPEEILKLPNIEIIVQRLLPYSLRHQERIKNFQKNAAHIDYMFSSMRLN